jgi:hypothetical protein
MQHGQGKMVFSNGQVKEGRFENNYFIEQDENDGVTSNVRPRSSKSTKSAVSRRPKSKQALKKPLLNQLIYLP